MGAYIPGMDEHNAVNDGDGFSTGFLGNKKGSSFNPMPPQGYINGNQQNFQNNQNSFQSNQSGFQGNQNNLINNQPEPSGNFQGFTSVDEQRAQPSGVDQIQIISSVDEGKKMEVPDFPINLGNNANNSNQTSSPTSPFSVMNQNNQPTNDNSLGFSNSQVAPMNVMLKTSSEKKREKEMQLPPQLSMKIEEVKNEDKKKEENGVKGTPEDPLMNKINDIIQKKENESKKSNKKKSNKIVHIVALSIIILLLLFIILYSTGVFKSKKKVPVSSSQQTPVDTGKEQTQGILVKLNDGCKNLSSSGTYGTESISSDSTCKNLVCFIENKVICQNAICMIAVNDKVYTRVCETGETRVANKNDFQAKVNLDLLCDVLNNSPSLDGNIQDEYGSCSNYECTTKVDGKEYNATCQKNG